VLSRGRAHLSLHHHCVDAAGLGVVVIGDTSLVSGRVTTTAHGWPARHRTVGPLVARVDRLLRITAAGRGGEEMMIV